MQRKEVGHLFPEHTGHETFFPGDIVPQIQDAESMYRFWSGLSTLVDLSWSGYSGRSGHRQTSHVKSRSREYTNIVAALL